MAGAVRLLAKDLAMGISGIPENLPELRGRMENGDGIGSPLVYSLLNGFKYEGRKGKQETTSIDAVQNQLANLTPASSPRSNNRLSNRLSERMNRALIYSGRNARPARPRPRNLHHLRSRHPLLRFLDPAPEDAPALDHHYVQIDGGSDAVGRSVEGKDLGGGKRRRRRADIGIAEQEGGDDLSSGLSTVRVHNRLNGRARVDSSDFTRTHAQRSADSNLQRSTTIRTLPASFVEGFIHQPIEASPCGGPFRTLC